MQLVSGWTSEAGEEPAPERGWKTQILSNVVDWDFLTLLSTETIA